MSMFIWKRRRKQDSTTSRGSRPAKRIFAFGKQLGDQRQFHGVERLLVDERLGRRIDSGLRAGAANKVRAKRGRPSRIDPPACRACRRCP